MAIDPKLIDKLLAEHGHRPQDIAGENGLLKQLTKALLERAMNAELKDHLGYESTILPAITAKRRNGKTKKTLKGTSARSIWRRRAIVTARLSRRSSKNTRPGSRVLTTRSCRCMRAG